MVFRTIAIRPAILHKEIDVFGPVLSGRLMYGASVSRTILSSDMKRTASSKSLSKKFYRQFQNRSLRHHNNFSLLQYYRQSKLYFPSSLPQYSVTSSSNKAISIIFQIIMQDIPSLHKFSFPYNLLIAFCIFSIPESFSTNVTASCAICTCLKRSSIP